MEKGVGGSGEQGGRCGENNREFYSMFSINLMKPMILCKRITSIDINSCEIRGILNFNISCQVLPPSSPFSATVVAGNEARGT